MPAHNSTDTKRTNRSSSWLFIIPAMALCAVFAVLVFRWIPRDLAKASDKSAADASYTLRGVIDTLPQATGPDKYIKIHHESLPTFKNKKGEVVGMPEMIMDFEQIAPEIPIGEFKVGDAVEFTFEVRWSPRVVTRVVRMRAMEAGTVLPLRAVKEPK